MSKQQNTPGWVGREIAAGSIRAAAYYVTVTYIIPIGIPILAGYVGYLQGLPWMHIMVGTGLMFAGVATGLVRFDEWRERRRVEGKLRFLNVRFGRNIRGAGVFLGVLLANKANVPLGFEITDVRTRIGDQVPGETVFGKKDFTVQFQGYAWFDDHIINIKDPPHAGTLEGFVDFRLKYGRLGMLKHDLHIKKQVIVAFNADGLLERGSWIDAA